jgi:hypothetical protein
LFVLLTSAVVACAPEVGLTGAVDQFLETYNSYRIDQALELVTADVVLVEPGATPLRGRTALRARMQWDSVLATRFQATPARVRGDTVELLGLRQASAWLQLLGIDHLERRAPRFVFRDGLIERISLGAITQAGREALDRGLDDFLPWAQHEFPQRLARVRPDGEFDHQARYAADLLSLLQEWRRPER